MIEIRKGYYLIDFESLPVLKADQYEYLKEENFDYLNDFYYDHLANSNERLSIVHKIPSKVSAVSSEYHDIDGNDMSIVELAFLGKYKRKRSNKWVTNEKSESIGIVSVSEDNENKEDFEIVNTSMDDSLEHDYRLRSTIQSKTKQKLDQILKTPQKSDRFRLGNIKGSNENSNFESPKQEILSLNAGFNQGLEQTIKINRKLSMDDIVPRNNHQILSMIKHDDQNIIMQQKLGMLLMVLSFYVKITFLFATLIVILIDITMNIKLLDIDNKRSREVMTDSASAQNTDLASIEQLESLPILEDKFTVQLWKMDKTQQLENILNDHMDWYNAKFDTTVNEVIKAFRHQKSDKLDSDIMDEIEIDMADAKSVDSCEYVENQMETSSTLEGLKFGAFKQKSQENERMVKWDQMSNRNIVKAMS